MKPAGKLSAFPFFLFLLPVFFVLHGYAQNLASITEKEVFQLIAEYLLLSGALFGLGWLIFRRRQKAALFSFGLLAVQFFFGAVHDGLKKVSAAFFLAKYSVLLPVLLLLLLAFLLFIRRSERHYRRFFIYLNLIFALLIAIELPSLFNQPKKPAQSKFSPCDTCDRPDVYFIIADEYADSISLNDALHFNNSNFQSALRSRGFHVVEGSKAVYNFTPFAMASLFQMNYLQGLEGSNSDKHDINLCQKAINHNPVVNFFKENGYEVKNFSIFTVDDQSPQAEQKYLVMGADLIRNQTFTQRLQRDLGYHLVTTLKWQSEVERYLFYTKRCNEKLTSLLQDEVHQKSNEPKFVYTHLLMPHYPYYFDKEGNQRPVSFFAPGYEINEEAYVEYLQYCNKIFLQLIDEIKANSAKPPVIVFMGDHGFREYAHPSQLDQKYYFMNLNAIFLPKRNYGAFYNGMSGVNQFRALLNSAFGQRLPMLKDTAILLRE